MGTQELQIIHTHSHLLCYSSVSQSMALGALKRTPDAEMEVLSPVLKGK